MIESLMQVGIYLLMLLCFMVANWLLGTFYNVVSLDYDFDKKKFLNGLLKFAVILFAITLLVIGINIASQQASEFVDTTIINIGALFVILGGASGFYFYESTKHLVKILNYKGSVIDEGKH